MDLESLADFIRQQKDELAKEKREFEDRRVPSLSPSPKHAVHPSSPEDSYRMGEPNKEEDNHPQIDDEEEEEEMSNKHSIFQFEPRAATAGEQPVSESFYNFFPSFNSKKQQKLDERRKEYFEYLQMIKTSTPPAITKEPQTSMEYEDLDDRRRLEKDRLAAQFQKSKQKSILNYQIVEARNKRAEEDVQRKKQEYHDELVKQIEERKRRQEARKTMDKMEEDILNRKIELEELESHPLPVENPPQMQVIRTERHQCRKRVDSESDSQNSFDKEKETSYNYFTNSAREATKAMIQPPAPEPKHCCENYKLILDKLESLCRWRDEFVNGKKGKRIGNGCLLCDSGSLKNCNFCDYHETIIKDKDPLESSSTDSERDEFARKEKMRRNPGKTKKSYKMITDSLADKPTPQVYIHRSSEEFHQEISPKKDSPTEKRNSFINFDDIPLPAQRKTEPIRHTVVPIEEPVMTSSRRQLEEMKRVEWKWDIPAEQKNKIDKGKPEKVLTQLGAIRKQLQMEQLKME